MQRLLVVLVLVGTGMSSAGSALAAAYRVTDLGVLARGGSSTAMGVNGLGVVAGYVPTSPLVTHAVLWRGGRIVDLNRSLRLPADASQAQAVANAVNGVGDAVGNVTVATPSDYFLRAFLWHAGKATYLGQMSVANDVNASDEVVGYGPSAAGFITARAWQSGVESDLSTYGGGMSQALAVNDAGTIVGQGTGQGSGHAYLWAGTTAADLGTLGGCSAVAYDINNAGTVVGTSDTSGNCGAMSHAFLWQSGTMADLGTLPGDTLSQANAINGNGVIVGFSQQPFSGLMRAFVDSGGQMIDLNTLIRSGSGWLLTDAEDINDSGQIVGSGIHNGADHAYLLTPVG